MKAKAEAKKIAEEKAAAAAAEAKRVEDEKAAEAEAKAQAAIKEAEVAIKSVEKEEVATEKTKTDLNVFGSFFAPKPSPSATKKVAPKKVEKPVAPTPPKPVVATKVETEQPVLGGFANIFGSKLHLLMVNTPNNFITSEEAQNRMQN